MSLLVLSLWPWVLGTLATILLLSGLDDLVPSLICFWHVAIRRRRAALCEEPRQERRIAIFVPCWKESGVIANMVRHNLAAVRYGNYDFFLGVYPNDTATFQVVRQLSATFHNVHVAACPHPGPTSKADCLNWVYQRMLLHETEHGDYFDTIVLHDAEDLIHPEALSVINRERVRNAMVQVPVLPLPTPFSEFTHGTYCDDFAEYQTIDMRARQFCQSFVPSNGVGTGFARHVLEQLARERGNLVFDPASLTEDYEIGVYIYNAGFCQTFVPLTPASQGLIATREYFPRRVRSAIRQRTRWVTGIGLQSWARDGWRGSWLCRYWFWRDRKGLFHQSAESADKHAVHSGAGGLDSGVHSTPALAVWRIESRRGGVVLDYVGHAVRPADDADVLHGADLRANFRVGRAAAAVSPELHQLLRLARRSVAIRECALA